MKSLKKSIIGIIAITMVIMCVGIVSVTLYIFQSSFKKLENQLVVDTTIRVREMMYQIHERVNLLTLDWAAWDSPADYISGKYSDFFEKEVSDEWFSSAQIDICGILDYSGKLLDMRVSGSSQQLQSLFVNNISVELEKFVSQSTASKEGSIHSTLIDIDGIPLFFAFAEIVGSDRTMSKQGFIFMGRLIASDVQRELAEKAKTSIKIEPYSKYADEDHQAPDTSTQVTSEIENEYAVGHAALVNAEQQPVFILLVPQKRDIYTFGMHSASMLLLYIEVLYVILTGVFIYILQRIFFQPLQQIINEISAITISSLQDAHISPVNIEEFHRILLSVNSLIDHAKNLMTKTSDDSKLLVDQMRMLEEKSLESESIRQALINLLEDQKDLSSQLEKEKSNIELKIRERTLELEQKNDALETAKQQVSLGWMQLQQEKARLTSSINSLDLGYILTDSNKSILLSNTAVETMVHEGNLTSRLLTDIHVMKNQQVLDAIHTSIHKKQSSSVKGIFVGVRIFDYFIAPVLLNEQNNELLGLVILMVDVTEVRNLERSRDEFFSIASHELRTPLTAIRGNTALIKQYFIDVINKTPMLSDMVGDIHASAVRLIELVNDFLDTSRLELGKMQFTIVSFSLPKLIEESIKECEMLDKKIPIKLAACPDYQVSADRNRVKQVIINLIGNSLKFTDRGEISIAVYEQDAAVEVHITDQGRGISTENQHLLFHKFQQAGDSLYTRDATKGSGLGLYISKLLIEKMNGKIWLVKSELEKGSEFALRLPKST